MKDIDNIIFDLGGVLIDIDISKTLAAFTALGVKNIDAYFGHGFAASFVKEHEIGKISNEDFIAEIKSTVGGDLSDADIVGAWNALLLRFPPERIDLLRSLKKKYRLFLFSNTNSIHHQQFQQMYSEVYPWERFDSHFERAYYSHVLGQRKPDIASYQTIVDTHHLDPKKTLFVDDALVNVEGAVKSGIQGLYLPPAMTVLDINWDIGMRGI